MKLNERLRQLRVESGETLYAVAAGAQLSAPYISYLERGRGVGTMNTLVKLAEHYGITLRALLAPVERIDQREDRLRLESLPLGLQEYMREPLAPLTDDMVRLLARIERDGIRPRSPEQYAELHFVFSRHAGSWL